MKPNFIFFTILCNLLFGTLSMASTQTGRYLTVENKPLSSQIHLLSQTIQVHFPQNIQTVGDAMNYLLHISGYSLVSENNMCPALKITLSKPLPIIDRSLGPLSLKDGLTTLAGPVFALIQDPINRTVNFDLTPEYQKKIQHPKKYRGKA
jgi:conjugative transfer region protein (TIGR03748 family)